jgi:hypothetical protein
MAADRNAWPWPPSPQQLERDRRWMTRRAHGEPTLPTSAELAHLRMDEAATVIAAAAARAAAWWRGEPVPTDRAAIIAARRQLLAHRVRAEVQLPPPPLPRAYTAPPCPWCGRPCEREAPACREHDELERGFLQAAGDGWG